jgi:hypothetical protein
MVDERDRRYGERLESPAVQLRDRGWHAECLGGPAATRIELAATLSEVAQRDRQLARCQHAVIEAFRCPAEGRVDGLPDIFHHLRDVGSQRLITPPGPAAVQQHIPSSAVQVARVQHARGERIRHTHLARCCRYGPSTPDCRTVAVLSNKCLDV